MLEDSWRARVYVWYGARSKIRVPLQSEDAKQRYESKVNVAGTGLTVDPYVIDDWTQDPETVPRLAWSDVCCVWFPRLARSLKKPTPSPFTKEALKVLQLIFRDMKA